MNQERAPEDTAGRRPAFVPGGPWPRPEDGTGPPAVAISGDDWPGSTEYLRGVALFNSGYYWEAHEAWEALWHAQGRSGPTADVLKGLIKLAAAGVKVRQRQPHGVVIHARRAAETFARAQQFGGDRRLGLDLPELIAQSLRIADHPTEDPAPLGAMVSVVFGFRLEPREINSRLEIRD